MAPRTQPQDRKPKTPPKEKKVSTAAEWKKSTTGFDIEVPSGQLCRAKRVDMTVLLSQGVIPNSLVPIVQNALKTGEFDTEELKNDLDMDKLNDILGLYDAVVCACVLQPLIQPVPHDDDGNAIPISLRDESALYVDEIDMDDKVFLFQWAVGGTADLERFRTEQSAAMESLRSS